MRQVKLSPVDTWFFRDSRPFSADLGYQLHISGVFPPHPPTVAGCLRGALALGQGWTGNGEWSTSLTQVLGDGPENLGRLRFAGPFLLSGDQTLFSVPRHLVWTRPKNPGRTVKALLTPMELVCSDLGTSVPFPDIRVQTGDAEGELFKNYSKSAFFDKAGLNAVLAGKTPDGEPMDNLWSEEPRVGLERDDEKRTASEGKLYNTRHFRLKEGVAIAMMIEGVPGNWSFSKTVPFGGEARLAAVEEWNGKLGVQQPIEEICRSGRFVIVALTPLDLPDEASLPGGRIDEFGAEVVSGCMDRPLRIGGWDFRNGPLPLRNYLAPGSVLFCEGASDSVSTALDRLNAADRPLAIGRRQEVGFGRIALGVWPGEREKP